MDRPCGAAEVIGVWVSLSARSSRRDGSGDGIRKRAEEMVQAHGRSDTCAADGIRSGVDATEQLRQRFTLFGLCHGLFQKDLMKVLGVGSQSSDGSSHHLGVVPGVHE